MSNQGSSYFDVPFSLESTFDARHDILFAVQHGCVTWVSDSVVAILGQAPGDVTGARFDALFFSTQNESALDALVASHQAGWQDLLFQSKSGAERFRVKAIGPLSNGVGILARIDRSALTQLKLDDMRNRVRIIFNSIPFGLMIVTPDGKLEAVNPALAQLLERKEREFFSGTLTLLFRPESARQLDRMLSEHSLEQHFEQHFELLELEAITSSHEIVLVDVVGRMFESEGHAKAILAITDATNRIQLERLRQDLLGMVSHDLRAPLASVDSFLKMMPSAEYGTLSEVGTVKLKQARERIASLNRMVRDLIEMARFDAGAIKLRVSQFTCVDLISESVAAVSELAKDKNIDISIGECQIAMAGDYERLTQVIVNLLVNAVHYSPRDTQVRIWAKTQDADNLEICVQDQGQGVRPEERKCIFEKFRSSSHSNSSGIGLGLAICKQLVELHGGSIGCDDVQSFQNISNSQNSGSIFWVRLPSGVEPVAKTSDSCD